jgi:hypothetical protein
VKIRARLRWTDQRCVAAVVLVLAVAACSSGGSQIAGDAGVDGHEVDVPDTGTEPVPDGTDETRQEMGAPCVIASDCGDTTVLACSGPGGGAGGTCQACGAAGQLCCDISQCHSGSTCGLVPELPRYCFANPLLDGGSD